MTRQRDMPFAPASGPTGRAASGRLIYQDEFEVGAGVSPIAALTGIGGFQSLLPAWSAYNYQGDGLAWQDAAVQRGSAFSNVPAADLSHNWGGAVVDISAAIPPVSAGTWFGLLYGRIGIQSARNSRWATPPESRVLVGVLLSTADLATVDGDFLAGGLVFAGGDAAMFGAQYTDHATLATETVGGEGMLLSAYVRMLVAYDADDDTTDVSVQCSPDGLGWLGVYSSPTLLGRPKVLGWGGSGFRDDAVSQVPAVGSWCDYLRFELLAAGVDPFGALDVLTSGGRNFPGGR